MCTPKAQVDGRGAAGRWFSLPEVTLWTRRSRDWRGQPGHGCSKSWGKGGL